MSARRSASRASDTGGGQQKRAQWSTQSYTVDDIVKQFTLPQVVKCNPQTLRVKRDSPLPVNLGQPIMLYEARTVRKLLARNVVMDASSGKFAENEETVVIPRDYEGSFLRLRSSTCKDNTTHKSVESLSKSSVKAFLNITKLAAFHVINKDNGAVTHQRIDYMAGNVFAIDSIFTAAKIKDGKHSSHKHNSVQNLHYLKCRDEKDNVIVVPLSQAGEFVEILPNSLTDSGRMSVKSEDLIESQKFPIIVRYIRGRFKPRLTSFTGLFTLLDTYEETTLIGCVLNKTEYTLIELPIGSPLNFHLALNIHELQSHPIVRNALRLCETSAQNFARDLKFKFKFAQQFVQMGPRRHPMEEDADDPGEPPSARNSARMGVTTTYIYI